MRTNFFMTRFLHGSLKTRLSATWAELAENPTFQARDDNGVSKSSVRAIPTS
jgi:hypothetical protein